MSDKRFSISLDDIMAVASLIGVTSALITTARENGMATAAVENAREVSAKAEAAIRSAKPIVDQEA